MIIHQIYGLLDDGPMPELFTKLQKKVKAFASKNNYQYKLWGKKDIENLANKYPKYKSMINNARYNIMKVDIGRFLILYDRGGLYMDLDVEPKISKLKDYDFALSTSSKGSKFNMEVVQGKKGNQLLLDYLDYVKEQIAEKSKMDIYKTRKGRFVLHTTGPYSLIRWVKKNKLKPETYNVNNSTNYNNKPVFNLTGNEDFLSYPSASWVGKD